MAEDADREAAVLDRIESFRRRRPRLTDDVVTLAHGAGGKASLALVDAVFLEVLGGGEGPLVDATTLELPAGERIAFTTDSFVVKPWQFPGGSIGDLAVNGTVNDLAVVGAQPRWLSAAFVIEEGFSVEDLHVDRGGHGCGCRDCGCHVVTGDTKVVGRGRRTGCTSRPLASVLSRRARTLGADRVQPDDVVVISGSIGDHGMAVMLARGDLALEADIRSDSAALTGLVASLLEAAPSTRWMRDPTRGAWARCATNWLATPASGVILDESALPVAPAVGGACDLLGIDPLYVANEGKVVAVVAPDEADAALAAMRSHAIGAGATRIGHIVGDPAVSSCC